MWQVSHAEDTYRTKYDATAALIFTMEFLRWTKAKASFTVMRSFSAASQKAPRPSVGHSSREDPRYQDPNVDTKLHLPQSREVGAENFFLEARHAIGKENCQPQDCRR